MTSRDDDTASEPAAPEAPAVARTRTPFDSTLRPAEPVAVARTTTPFEPTLRPEPATEPTLAATPRPDAGSDPTLAATPRPDAGSDPTLAATPRPLGDTTASEAAPLPGSVDELTIVDRAHYEVLGELGRGGLGRVLRARDRRIGRIVAVKEALRASPGLLARFAREAIVTANLQHPAIVPVYEVGRWTNGEPFYAMKVVAGRSLAEAARDAKSLRERLALLPHVIAVADALAYAHGEHVIHRDLKPANVLIGDYGETVVIDWGLAKRLREVDGDTLPDIVDAAAGETVAGSVLGTPGYMAPEQARGEDTDERADVYAIGAMLYEVLGGSRPYGESRQVDELLARVAAEPPRPLAELAADAPRELVAIVERAMAHRAADRYPTSKELADDLKRYQTGQLVGAHQYTAWMLVRRWLRKHRGVVAASALGIAALGVVGAFSIARIRAARDRAVAAQAVAEDRAAALAEQQGRQLAIAGDAPRALPYLAAAVQAGRHSPALQFVLARALAQVEPVEAVLSGATAVVGSVAYSPDGTRLAAASADGLRIWDPRSHRVLATIGKATLAQWSPDGRYVATLDPAGAVVLIDPTGAELARMLPAATVSALAIAPDGALIAAGMIDGHLAIWTRRGEPQLFAAAHHARPDDVNLDHPAQINEVHFSPDGTKLATAGNDRTATVWTLGGGKPLTLTLEARVRDAGFSPDGTRVVTGDVDGHVIAWDATTGARGIAFEGHENSVESVRFDRAGTRLVTASSDDTAALWDASTGTQLAVLPHASHVIEARFAPRGDTIITRSEDGKLALWSTAGELLHELAGHVGAPTSMDISPDGTQLASSGTDRDVRLWKLTAPPAVVTLPAGGAMSWRGEWSPDGRWVAVTGKDGVARMFDGQTGALVHELRAHTAEVMRVAWSPDARQLATASVDATIKVWNAETGAVVRTLAPAAARVRFVAYSHDGTRLASTHDDGTVRIWNAATGAPITTLTPPRGHPRTALWSPDDTRILTPLDGPGATLWDQRGTLVAEAELPTELVIDAAWSRDGAQFALGGTTAIARTFDGHTAQLIASHVHALGPISSLEYAPNGELLATASTEGVVRLWERTNQRLMFGDGTTRIGDVTFRGDGALLATCDQDVRVWDASTGELVGELHGVRNVTNGAFTEVHWSPDGTRLLALGLAASPRIWRIPAWTGNATDLATRLRCIERWRLDSSALVLATPDPSACR